MNCYDVIFILCDNFVTKTSMVAKLRNYSMWKPRNDLELRRLEKSFDHIHQYIHNLAQHPLQSFFQLNLSLILITRWYNNFVGGKIENHLEAEEPMLKSAWYLAVRLTYRSTFIGCLYSLNLRFDSPHYWCGVKIRQNCSWVKFTL